MSILGIKGIKNAGQKRMKNKASVMAESPPIALKLVTYINFSDEWCVCATHLPFLPTRR